MYIISKNFYFEAAHLLDNAYSKECTKVHGHSFKLEICLKNDLDKDGMVCDFKRVKQLITWLIDRLDHSLILSEKAYYDKFHGRGLEKSIEFFLVKKSPTAENMAEFIFNEIKGSLPGLYSVTLWETKDAKATYGVKA